MNKFIKNKYNIKFFSFFYSSNLINNLIIMMIFTAPYYQYRFDIPIIPFHFTVHRLFLFIALIISFFHFLISEKKLRKRTILSINFLLIWGFFEIVCSLRSDYIEGINRLFPRFVLIITAFLIIYFTDCNEKIITYLYFFVLSSIIPVFIGIWQIITWVQTHRFPGIPFIGFLRSNLRVFEEAYKGAQYINLPIIGIFPRISSVMVDPNYFSSYLSLITIIMVIFLIQKSKYKTMIFVNYGFLIILIVVNLFTFSRSGIIGLFIGIIIFNFKSKNIKVMKKYQFFLFFLLILILIFSNNINDIYKFRFNLNNLISGITQRMPLFNSALLAFSKNPLFGVGAFNMMKISNNYTAHSTPLTILAEYGIFGFLFFYVGFFLIGFRPFILIKRSRIYLRKLNGSDNIIYQILISATFALMIPTIAYDHLFDLETNWVFIGILFAASNIYR